MANIHRAPKQWCLSKVETVNSFENWKQNLVYTLSLDPNFAPFLIEGTEWLKKSRDAPHRGFTNDGEEVPQARRRTREQKVSMLEMMLGQIANYCPVISRSTIVKNSVSLNSIWQTIRLHFGFQSTGAHFLDFASIKLEANERPEDLFQRIMAFMEDNLLRRDMGITHHGVNIADDEEMSPTLENIAVLTWLRLIHADLPRLVKQRYGTELRSRTLSSIKPEISQALDSLLEEIRSNDDVKTMRTAITNNKLPNGPRVLMRPSPQNSSKICPLCKAANRPNNHYLSKCSFLPAQDRRYLAKARRVSGTDDYDSGDDDCHDQQAQEPSQIQTACRVQIRQSPFIDVFYSHHTVRLTIDSGATGNMIRTSVATTLGAQIKTTAQSAHQADGLSPLHVIGETRLTFHHNGYELYFEGLVVDNIDTDVLAGIPFMERNDISIRPARHEVVLAGKDIYTYGVQSLDNDRHVIRRAHVLRAPVAETTTVWPGEYLEVKLPEDIAPNDDTFSIEPHEPDHVCSWPSPGLISSVSGSIRIPNLTLEPHTVKRNDHICKIRSTFCPETANAEPTILPKPVRSKTVTNFSENVRIDPDSILTEEMRSRFRHLLHQHDIVFNPNFSGYNGAAGPIKAHVNMGPVQPPQRKGRVPQYSRHQMDRLQEKFDELEQLGVFRRPEDVDVNVEYVNPSFLIKKPSGDFRLVTAFADVGRYSKPQPSLMPDVDSTLRQIAQWNCIAVSDLTKSFYQIPLAKESMKYCGVVTPYRGVRVYARSAMGMPGSETALEELTCRILGHLVQEGVVAKVADDLYCGGASPEDLLSNFSRLIEALQQSGLSLSASKTVIAPKEVTILGWIWRQGTIRASPHRISSLASCQPPTTVTSLRSFVGAYKVLGRVIKGCSTLLSPFDEATAGRDSKDRIAWSEDLLASFKKAQDALATNQSITLPHSNDQLWIVTDGAAKCKGLGATLYTTRNDKVLLAGFFSAKLRKNQSLWIPCEVEALSIASAVKHFSPYIIQAASKTCILTDSKPCVQAYEKLCRGEFSASPRVSTFLSTASRYQVSIRHVAGAAILPSDFASRNAADCENPQCQICLFASSVDDSVVRHISTQDILNYSVKLPFTSRPAWCNIQSECPDLRRTHAHLKQGTRPSKKLTDIKDVKRYLQCASIAKDGLLVVKKDIPFEAQRESIIVPRSVLEGLLTSLHIKLDHPSQHQLKTVVQRYFFALDMDKAINNITSGCHQCASLRNVQRYTQDQSSGDPPDKVGFLFAADVLKRERQLILVVREYVTSYTRTVLLENERHDSLRDGLIHLCSEMHPLDGPYAVIRTDAAPGFTSLVNDSELSRHRLRIEVGRIKNPNKNPVAERAIQELEDEILRQDPQCKAVTSLLLTLATARMNSRLRNRGLSAREMWTQRDQFSHSQIPVADQDMILRQHQLKLTNHPYSEKSKYPKARTPTHIQSQVGDLVYLNDDRNKSAGRDRYLVVSCDGQWRNVRKFAGNQLRRSSYRVKDSDLYKVPSFTVTTANRPTMSSNVSDSSDDEESPPCESLPCEPPLTQPPSQEHDHVTGIQLNESLQPHQLPNIPAVISDIPTASKDASTDSCDDRSPGQNTDRPQRTRKTPKWLNDYIY